MPATDVLVVPGGFGTRREMLNTGLLEWIGKCAAQAEVTLSVCTGAVLLAKAGVLDGLRATTHHMAVDLLRQAAPKSVIEPERRVIDNGRIVVAAGVSAGIDASFHVVARLLGKEVALETARYIEYDWTDEGE
ncbi:MAG: DJ-1/PfpI family protein [Acidobacteriota bacterium]